MATKTTYLELVKQNKNDNVNKWHIVENADWQIIDDELLALATSLVVTPTKSDYTALNGSMSTLEERLDVGINDDGTLDASAIDGDVDRARYSQNEATTMLDERLQRMEEGTLVEAPVMTLASGNLKSPKSRDDTLFLDGNSTSTPENWFYYGTISSMFNISVSNLLHTFAFNCIGATLGTELVWNGNSYKLTRASADLVSPTLSFVPDSNTIHYFSIYLTGRSSDDEVRIGSAGIDCQLTRAGVSTTTAVAVGDSVFTATNIGIGDAGLNDWEPAIGELLVIGTRAYKIESFLANTVTIYGKFDQVYTIGTAYRIMDYSQPNLYVWFTPSLSGTLFRTSELLSAYNHSYSGVRVLSGSAWYDAAGLHGAPAWFLYYNFNYATQSTSLLSSHSKTLRIEMGTSLPSGDPLIVNTDYYTKDITTTIGDFPTIRGITVWVTTEDKILIEPCVACVDSNGDWQYVKAFHAQLDCSVANTTTLEIGKILDYEDAAAHLVCIREVYATGWANSGAPNDLGEIQYADITEWGVYIDFV